MRFPVAYYVKRGGHSIGVFHSIGLFEGWALIGTAPDSEDDEWQVSGILIQGWNDQGKEELVQLASTDPLFTEISLWLYAEKSKDIEWEWGQHVRECRLNKEAV